MRIDYLPYINIPYCQNEDSYHFNSDTVLLGNYLRCQNKTVLDIGTGGGALLLYALKAGAKEVCGIDIDAEMIKLAKRNIKDKAELYECDIKDFKHAEFDIIVSNPPFYRKDIHSLKHQSALNSDYLPLMLLFSKARSLLKYNGSLFLIYEANSLTEVIKEAYENDFSIAEICPVFDMNKSYAIRHLFIFKRGKNTDCHLIRPIFIKEGEIIYG